ncbi:MAG: hypothetical protein KDB07_00025, partial [Planctomycetes bacterium]|nr:hypothetical protein [Planctomycetota bacterium]
GAIGAIAVEPKEIEHSDAKYRTKRDAEDKRGGRLFVGTARGLYYTDNRGIDWIESKEVHGSPIGGIVINPYDTDQVFLFEGWTTLDDEIEPLLATGESLASERRVWVSQDRGENFKEVKYEKTKGYRRVYSLVIDPIEPSTLYLGAHSGAYKSTNSGKSWKRLDDPKGAKSGVRDTERGDGCRGIDLSADGKTLVGVFVDGEDNTLPFVSDTKRHRWEPIGEGLPRRAAGGGGGRWNRGGGNNNNEYAFPRFLATDASEVPQILLGQLSGQRLGLYRGTVAEEKKELKATWEVICANPSGEGDTNFKFDMGWTRGPFRVRAIDISPAAWGKQSIWISTTETVLVGNPRANGFPYTSQSWKDITTKGVGGGEGERTSATTKGLQANDIKSFTSSGSYRAAGTSDNGIIESFDGGKNWSRAQNPEQFSTNIEALAAFEDRQTMVLAATRLPAFRGADERTVLSAKSLLNKNNSDEWVAIGGGRQNLSGLPSDSIRKIAPNPHAAGQVALALSSGVYWTINVVGIKDGDGGSWQEITKGSGIAGADIADLVFDPSNGETLWAAARGKKAGIWRGEYSNKKWKWSQVESVKNAERVGKLAVWKHNDATMIALTLAPAGRDQAEILLSRNGSEEFSSLWSTAQAEEYVKAPWLELKGARENLAFTAITARGDDLFVSLGDLQAKRGLGVFRLKVLGNGQAIVQPYNGTGPGEIQQRLATVLSVIGSGANSTLYAALPGAGLAKRTLDDFIASAKIAKTE